MAAIQYTGRGMGGRPDPVGRVLTQAVFASLDTSSILNARPWRWIISGDTAQLRSIRALPRPTTTSDARQLLLSSGAALHHARVVLAADGFASELTLLPDDRDSDLLANLRWAGQQERPPGMQRLRRAIGLRRTDRRAFADEPMSDDQVDLLRDAAESAGAHVKIVRSPDLAEVGTELTPTDLNARYVLVLAASDTRRDWLRAGEALSAVLLTAAAEGLAAAPMAHLIEAGTATSPQRPLPGGDSYPAIAIRVGVADRVNSQRP